MKKEYQFKLVEGQFEPTEAGKVLFSLINSKINYHNLEQFSNEIRFDQDHLHSKRRKETLQEASDYIKELIKEADAKNMELCVNGVIQIEMQPRLKQEADV
ncbi:hypothetical protein DNC80_02690 [Flavobacterium sp. SOK18b]|jgi:hypothetical protein|uniref:hypothetical protein n=1 Tax=Flavobacterium TaxID=237 RepID=UPI00119F86FB|nr:MULTISPECIES: hypothetical protein [Flavobacterium]MBB1192574.1 hypothetical protein [Flavobacterium sp. SOK18b]QZK89691.1 hypothetical protein K5V07_03975 [Flavobacterium sp. CHNK8]